MTDGERRTLLRGWIGLALVVAGFMTVNAMTVLHDQSHLDAWEPWVWEGSSAIAVVSLMWLPWLAIRKAPPEGGVLRPRFWLTHLVAVALWSVLHVLGFLVLRYAAYGLVGERYEFGPLVEEFPYEFRKDVLAYALFASTFWMIGRLGGGPRAQETPPTFDILDGQRVIRVPLDRIVAISSAGNYVEFLLDDGRKPLMRAALSAVEGDLGDKGFVRTHRSWLVNQARVTGLKPEGSGDWAVELGEVEAPLSRRFPGALKRLKGEA